MSANSAGATDDADAADDARAADDVGATLDARAASHTGHAGHTGDASPAAGPAHNEPPVARVSGRALHLPGEPIDAIALRQRACTELLRQAAQRAGLLDADDPIGADGVPSEAAVLAIDALLERELRVPEPSEDACRRHHAAHASRYGSGERVHARHVLFAVTPGIDVAALLAHAEPLLLRLRSATRGNAGDSAGHDVEPDTTDDVDAGIGGRADESAVDPAKDIPDDPFADAARRYSNCPSGAHAGDLGWLRREDCAPEFAAEIFGHPEIGVLPRLVRSRFGLHVVEVLERDPGVSKSFEEVRDAVALALRQQSYATALRQYVRVLAGEARIEGVDLDAADSPLVQ